MFQYINERSITQMYFNTLDRLRKQMYSSFKRRRDALFNLSDALLSESHARSLPELSLSVFFERRWPSVYEALQDGCINVERLREVFVQALLENIPTDEPIWLGIDSSSMQRLEAASLRDRGMIYVPNMAHATKPVSVGYQFSTVMLLPEQPRSWVGILEQRRIGTAQTAIQVDSEQLRALLPQMAGRRVILLADRWYATASFVQVYHELGAGALIRLKRNRKLYRAAPPRKPKQRGAPCKHGPLFQGTRPETYGPADAEWEGVDEHGKRVVVSCWTGLHFREALDVEVRVIRVLREAARDSKRDPRESWFV
jgi:DDE superfamily endonuclease